jgi:hypothetical protein
MIGGAIETVCVIGGGWSVRGVDLAALPGILIGVNDSAIHARVDIAVSMDRLWAEHRFVELRERRRLTYLRRSAVQNLDTRWPWLHVFDNDHESVELSEDLARLNGTNSGVCAINLAFQLRPKRIVLFGFDMNRSKHGAAHWYPAYPWTTAAGATSSGKYNAWAAQFDRIAAQCKAAGIEVVNASPTSAIKSFPKTSEFHRGAAA